MEYQNSRLAVPIELDEAFMRKLLFTKFKHWEYEQEYRIYTQLEEDIEGIYHAEFSDQLKLKQVIVGDQSDVGRSQVSGALGELNSSVETFKVRAAFTRFEVVRQPNSAKWALQVARRDAAPRCGLRLTTQPLDLNKMSPILFLKSIFFLLLSGILTCTIAIAEDYPVSVKKWIDEADYFYKMDFSKSDNDFKKELIKYYDDVFSGNLKKQVEDWIMEGSLYSEYYTDYYGTINVTETVKIDYIKHSNSCHLIQYVNHCFDGIYQSPNMSDIVSEYKIKNYTQSEINIWLQQFEDSFFYDWICLKTRYNVAVFLTTDKHPLIHQIRRELVSSTLDLNPPE